MVLQLLKDAGVALKPQKYAFFTNGLKYLVYIIRPRQLEVANHTADVVRELKRPTIVTKLRSFSGYATYLKELSRTLRDLRQFYQDVFRKHRRKTLDLLRKTSFRLLIL